MIKKILLFLLACPLFAYAKSYEVTISPCDIGSSCKKCYEVVQLTYIVDAKLKQVFASGKDLNEKEIKEPLENCQIRNVDNWSCDSSVVSVQADNGVINIFNRPRSSLASGKKEVCLINQVARY
jgi:hypothetical protein